MSYTLSPRQAESVERWLDDQPRSNKENDDFPQSRGRDDANEIRPVHHHGNLNAARHVHTHSHGHGHHDDDRDLHVHSRLLQHSRLQQHDHEAYIDPVECFLRVCSACLASGAIGVGAVTFALARATSPTVGSPLDNEISWVFSIPVAGLALLWQLIRLSLLAWHRQDRSNALLAIDIIAEAVLGFGAVICAILAGFQAARHLAYNKRHRNDGDDHRSYHDVGPDISLAVLLGLLMLSSFGILALSFVEGNRRRRGSSRSTSSSVIEIIS